MESPQVFVEEIDYGELNFLEVLGKGAFGVVSRAKWRSKDVAVKLIATESERKAFLTELKQLSRVSHPNIVRIYGACNKPPKVCLVMEYAEGGSLYNVLHCNLPPPQYTISHALSWSLQCANGVEYLHNMKPKALIHRDLKPPNLLLILGGTVLKICDFGTACDIQTHMTNNKGSAAWMAPEVFEGCNYTEKCDVFSWGIILWEVLTRHKPFDEIGGPAFRIMWAVHQGKRPPLIKNLPTPIEKLMKCCWSSIIMERPSMTEVVRVLTTFLPFFPGHHEPIVYPNSTMFQEDDDDEEDEIEEFLTEETPLTSTVTSTHGAMTHDVSISDTVRYALGLAKPLTPLPVQTPVARPVVVEEDFRSNLKSAPASLAASRESLLDVGSPSTPSVSDRYKRYSADIDRLDDCRTDQQVDSMASRLQSSHKLGHRRTGSYETTTSAAQNVPIFPGTQHARRQAAPFNINQPTAVGRPAVTLRNQPVMPPTNYSAWNHNVLLNQISDQVSNLDILGAVIDSQLQPIAPARSSPESVAIYEEHVQAADTYMKIQFEINMLIQRRQELLQECERDEKSEQNNFRLIDEYNKLKEENENLLKYHSHLKEQLQRTRSVSLA